MRSIRRTRHFKKDIKLLIKRGKTFNEFKAVVNSLEFGSRLPKKYLDHELRGKYKNCHECHIEPDWLLIYKGTETEIILIRTGTHADLFK